LNIIIVNHYAIPPTEAGGTRHYSLARELIAQGHHVHIIAANFNHQTKTPVVTNSEERIFKQVYDEVPFVFVNVPAYQGNSPARLLNMLSFSRQIWHSSYFKCMDSPDVVIGSSPHPLAVWAAQRMAARCGVPFIFEVRDLWPQSLIDLGRINPKHPAVWLLAQLEKYLYSHADKIITLLPGAHEYIKAIGIDAGKVIWIPNGIDFSLYNQDFPRGKHDKFVVMYAGTHGLANGLETIINCAEILDKDYGNKIVFRLVGDGPQKEDLKKMVDEKQLTNVQFDDPVPKQQIPGVLSQADAFILLLTDSPVFRWGISPNKLYDYLCSYRPVIFGVNAFNNPVEEAGAGITVPPENPEALAKAVLELYHMTPANRDQMGLNGRKYVEENHDFQKLAAKLEEVLLEVIVDNKVGSRVSV
jgi:glycosyltransferase involved in cell wall biosynthesis